MNPAEFLKAVRDRPATHFYSVTPDGGGMVLLLPGVLRKIAHERDIQVFDCARLTVTQARALAREAGMAPIGSSDVTHFVGWNTHLLGDTAAGALLLAIEEGKRGRFIFIADRDPGSGLRPLASRCVQIRLPFLAKRVVLGNLQALKHDARTADEKDLWDGTLGGTLANVRVAKEREAILAAVALGLRGLPELLEFSDSPAFDQILAGRLTEEERRFLEHESTPERRRLVAFQLLARGTPCES